VGADILALFDAHETDVVRKLLVLVPAAVLAACLYLVKLPLYAEGPGPAHDVIPRIDIDGVATYQPREELLFTTVNLGRVNLYDAVWTGFDPDYRLVPEDVVIPSGFTEEEYNRVTLSQMDVSKIAAVVSVLEQLGDYPRDHGPGALVHGTDPGLPAHGRLFPGDVITAIDGEPIADVAELADVIEDAGGGAVLRIEVEPLEGGTPEIVEVRTVRDPNQGRPRIGINVVPNFPFEVSIESGRIGGPSAGLMWALGVMDLLTPGDLGAGRTMAGTGGIDLRGRVFPIGGVQLKVLAAERAGADVFFLPRRNLQEAREAGADIDLAPVGNLQDALDYLQR
jgi:PDZ domain-containing protein